MILIIGPLLVALGVSTFTAHMFVFYIAVASAITSPVAVAAFAAASVAKSEPVATGLQVFRLGIVMFSVPFVFAFYPELLLISKAQLAAHGDSGPSYLPGYDGSIDWAALSWIVLRLLLALYLLASAVTRFDRRGLSSTVSFIRIGLAILVLTTVPVISNLSLAAGLALIVLHYRRVDRVRTVRRGG